MLKAIESNVIHVAVISARNRDDGWRELPMIRFIRLAHPEVGTVLMLEDYDQALVVSAFRCGVRGLFCPSESFRMLRKCIECVHCGQVWANREQIEWMFEALSQVPSLCMVKASGQQALSEREQQIVALIAEGLCNRDIADELNLTENTVKKYLFCIFNKLCVSTRLELAVYAAKKGIRLKAEWIPRGV
jgi:DNA-binding NarL/FixJ family response regulator